MFHWLRDQCAPDAHAKATSIGANSQVSFYKAAQREEEKLQLLCRTAKSSPNQAAKGTKNARGTGTSTDCTADKNRTPRLNATDSREFRKKRWIASLNRCALQR